MTSGETTMNVSTSGLSMGSENDLGDGHAGSAEKAQPVGEDRISSKNGKKYCNGCKELRRTPIGKGSKRCKSARHNCAGCKALNADSFRFKSGRKVALGTVDEDDDEARLRYIYDFRKRILRNLGPDFFAKYPEWEGIYKKNGKLIKGKRPPPCGRLTAEEDVPMDGPEDAGAPEKEETSDAEDTDGCEGKSENSDGSSTLSEE